MTLAIDVEGLSKSFGTFKAVDNISLQIEQGHITGFLGPNGSGKTTSLRMLCGLLTPDTGHGQVLGLEFPREAEAIKRQTGYMTQRFSLYEDLTIEENLAFIARVYASRMSLNVSRNRSTGSASTNRRKQLAGQLSGGWKQRLALAAAVMHDPKLLLLDEPTAGVDPQARRDFWDRIHGLADEGMTVLVSTHYMDEAERCHEIAYIFNGRLIARGTADAGDRRKPAGHVRGGGPARRPAGPGACRQARRRNGRALRRGTARQRHRPRRPGSRHPALSARALSLDRGPAHA